MLAEAKKVLKVQPNNSALQEYHEKILKKLDKIEDDKKPKMDQSEIQNLLLNMAKFIMKKVEENDPLFGHYDELKDIDFLAATFKKLVDMAQPEPLEEKWDNCMRTILDAILKVEKTKSNLFTMINLGMHKTGILGGKTLNLERRKMVECLKVTDLISKNDATLEKMKTDFTLSSELVDLLYDLKNNKDIKTEVEEKQMVTCSHFNLAIDLVDRLTDDDTSSLNFCSDIENIEKLVSVLKEFKSNTNMLDGILGIIKNHTHLDDNLSNCKDGGCAEGLVNISKDQITDVAKITRKMARIFGDLGKLTECKAYFGNNNVIDWILKSLAKFSNDAGVFLNCAYACKNFTQDQFKPNIDRIMENNI